jgi:hypothetical protein
LPGAAGKVQSRSFPPVSYMIGAFGFSREEIWLELEKRGPDVSEDE